ncbi:hypothetical protein K466DRAFT_28414 [Polyporus arcularius HHB13444]|uniref:Uncharacterized protein n=1 Tax=Polyporus arcularius HHB13444 TaxID=1314778 RepID=A0A5C3P0I1_9APHY|nr:hypothetical protein K466DRAFT_28414 [Polyporus arcularius HHB13444]
MVPTVMHRHSMQLAYTHLPRMLIPSSVPSRMLALALVALRAGDGPQPALKAVDPCSIIRGSHPLAGRNRTMSAGALPLLLITYPPSPCEESRRVRRLQHCSALASSVLLYHAPSTL